MFLIIFIIFINTLMQFVDKITYVVSFLQNLIFITELNCNVMFFYIFKLQIILARLKTLNKVNQGSDTLRAQLAEARAELAQYSEPERYDSSEYSNFIKWFRVKKRVQNLEEELNSQQQSGQMQSVYISLLMKYIVKMILFKILLIISIYYRNTPALIFRDDVNLEPLQSLLSFPTGIKNSISIPIWVIACNAGLGVISTIRKYKY